MTFQSRGFTCSVRGGLSVQSRGFTCSVRGFYLFSKDGLLVQSSGFISIHGVNLSSHRVSPDLLSVVGWDGEAGGTKFCRGVSLFS